MKQAFLNRMRTLATSKFAVATAVALVLMLFLPSKARGQFGLDPCCAIISAGLNSISGLLKSVVAAPLKAILDTQQQEAAFEQQVVYPAESISNALGLAGQFRTEFARLKQVSTINTGSATLPASQQLEQTLLSRNPAAISNVSSNYNAVFGTVMAPSGAPQAVRDLVDSTDGEAQAAMKKAVQMDSIADIELQAAEEMNQELQTASPGSAPIIGAQASAWLLRANAYTQSAMAELVRIRSIQLANDGARLKFSASHATTLRNGISQAVQR